MTSLTRFAILCVWRHTFLNLSKKSAQHDFNDILKMIKLTLSLHFVTTNHECFLLAQISLLERNLSQDEPNNQANRDLQTFHDSCLIGSDCCSTSIKIYDKCLRINSNERQKKVEVSTTIPRVFLCYFKRSRHKENLHTSWFTQESNIQNKFS